MGSGNTFTAGNGCSDGVRAVNGHRPMTIQSILDTDTTSALTVVQG